MIINRLLSKSQFEKLATQALGQLKEECERCRNPLLKQKHTCGAVKLRKKEPEDLTKLTDAALESRIFYSQDARAGESFSPLWDEYKRRYNKKKNECERLEHDMAKLKEKFPHLTDWEWLSRLS